jgi:hypothetical protein
MVPTARLELAQLSPLPPQDSVSTSFTTSAVCVIGLDKREVLQSKPLSILASKIRVLESNSRQMHAKLGQAL